MKDILNFGIWGCGLISDFHASAILETENARLVATFDKSEKSLNRFCEKYAVKGYCVQEDFLTDADIDAVCVCLPSGLHYEAAMACIKNKKHVLIEKPMCFNSTEADELINAAKNNGVFIGCVSQLRYSNGIMKAKEIVESGKLGTITIGNALMKYWRSEDYYNQSPWRGTWKMDGGGALMNQGIHGVDILLHLMGNAKSVFASFKTLVHNIEAEDTLSALIEFENGALGTIQATTSVNPGYARKIEICGSEGSLILSEDNIEVCDVKGYEDVCDAFEKSQNASSSSPNAIDCSLHLRQIKDFTTSVLNGKSPILDGYEGKRAVSLVDAIYKSAKTGEKVFI